MLDTVGALDTLIVSIELKPYVADELARGVAARFKAEVKRVVGVTPQVRLVQVGELPRFDMKARRFADRRATHTEEDSVDA